MNTSYKILALSMLLALGGQVGSLAQTETESADDASAAPAGSATKPVEKGPEEAPPPPEPFVPTEKVSPGTAISFPVDI